MEQHARLIDFHTHILPGADHGSSGIDETVNQMRMIQTYGVDTLVATPHFYPERHRVDSFVERIDHAASLLREQQIPFVSKLCLGAEVLYYENIDRMEGLEQLCIRGTNVLLLELPFDRWGRGVFDTVEALLRRYTVVLAHIDRYLPQSASIQTLLEMGAMAQVNAESLFSFGARRKLVPFIREGAVVALGSDLHNVDEKSYIKFTTAEKHLKSLHGEIMERSVTLLKNAENILA